MFSEISIACKTIELISNSFSSTQQQRDTAAIADSSASNPSHTLLAIIFNRSPKLGLFKYQQADL